MGNGGTVPLILNLATRQRRVFSFNSRLLYTWRNKHWYPLNRRVLGPQSKCGRFAEVRNMSCLAGHRRWISSFHNLVTKLAELSGFNNTNAKTNNAANNSSQCCVSISFNGRTVETSTNYINLLKTKRRLLCLKTQSVPRSKHFSSRFIRTNQFML